MIYYHYYYIFGGKGQGIVLVLFFPLNMTALKDKERKISLDTFAIKVKTKFKGHVVWEFLFGWFCHGATLDCSSTELHRQS